MKYISVVAILFCCMGTMVQGLGQVCQKAQEFCGPYIEIARCKQCCAKQFPLQQGKCLNWCSEGYPLQ